MNNVTVLHDGGPKGAVGDKVRILLDGNVVYESSSRIDPYELVSILRAVQGYEMVYSDMVYDFWNEEDF